jgi:hypothetical protein
MRFQIEHQYLGAVSNQNEQLGIPAHTGFLSVVQCQAIDH